jgi:hypothetical protein
MILLYKVIIHGATMQVDSQGQVRGTKTYTLPADDKPHSPGLENVVLCLPCVFRGNLDSECNDHEGEALTALPVEGSTQAPAIDTENRQ